jgi:hypothetical protein
MILVTSVLISCWYDSLRGAALWMLISSWQELLVNATKEEDTLGWDDKHHGGAYKVECLSAAYCPSSAKCLLTSAQVADGVPQYCDYVLFTNGDNLYNGMPPPRVL